jgi:hypothetical protein
MKILFYNKKLLRGCWLLLVLLSCKKERDTLPPQITIYSPVENSSFDIPAYINISAHIKEDKKIESINAEILNENQQIIASAAVDVGNYPDNKNINLNTTIYIDDRLLPSGNYHVRIKANDGTNHTSRYKKIYIHELTKELKDVLIFRKINSNLLSVEKLHQNNFLPVLSINTDFGFSSFCNRYQQLVIGGSYTGNISSYNYPQYDVAWQLPALNNPGQPYYYFLHHNKSEDLLYIGYSLGYIKAVNRFGNNMVYVALPNNFNPHICLENDGKIYAYLKEINGNQQKLNVYYKQSGALKNTLNINFEIIKLFALENGLIAALVNENNVGKIKLYNETGNNFYEPIPSSFSSFTDGLQTPFGLIYALSNNEIVVYNHAQNQIIPLTAFGGSAIQYNPLQNELYIANGNTLSVINASNGVINTQHTATGNISSVLLLFNK